ncbi:uncharacterized protein DUF4186 [Actinomadura pelletieri DSM 43383]|uniref:Uncharacterized protein DUF4186 n=1 Tax=Actinomadura pelletieri DSM 43383 TaxID=1120940 RepID=A0A495QX44_9ACTN|nr:DUF4186 family protein [Actinomadura pelletieri]RKS78647.1 uncharacterized protein DUF4186 [Actinomadura pelletieri DSM 43383]
MTGHHDDTGRPRTAANPPDSLPFPTKPLPELPPKWSASAADASPEGVWRDFDKVKIRCTMTSCGHGLHCYRLTKKLARLLGPGACRECHQPLVSLERTGQRDMADIDHTFAALQTEAIRHYFWHVPFGQKALDYAYRAGRRELHARIPRFVRSRIGKAEPFRDGTQTPTSREKANAIDYALHAVAACCRTCAQYWHGIGKGRPLTDAEISYLSELARRYLNARLPDLPEDGRYIPPRRRTAANAHSNLRMLPTAPVLNMKVTDLVHPHAS